MDVSAHVMACTLTALYAPGMHSPPLARANWRKVEACLRLSQRELSSVAQELSKQGLWAEAAAVQKPGILSKSEVLVLRKRVLTAGDRSYPVLWERKLGAAAAPVLWRSGQIQPGHYLTIVGSRHPPATSRDCAIAAAEEAARRGFTVASGGAFGVDAAARKGALRFSPLSMLEILPKGLSFAHSSRFCRLSAAPLGAQFSSALAMERNTLLFALADRVLVAHARFREGGAWEGACACLRRRLSTVFILQDGSRAAAALVALGAVAISSVEELFQPIEEQTQRSLFLQECAALYVA